MLDALTTLATTAATTFADASAAGTGPVELPVLAWILLVFAALK